MREDYGMWMDAYEKTVRQQIDELQDMLVLPKFKKKPLVPKDIKFTEADVAFLASVGMKP